MKTDKEIHTRFALSDDACFLCGDIFEEKSKEHVFPKWLQREHNLWDKSLNLLNGTSITYRQLTIPCCKGCNNNDLSELENRIQKSIQLGYESVIKLPRLQLFQWLGKIFYGILRKELSLPHDRKNRESESIIPDELIGRYTCLHTFLQSIREPFEFPLGEPFSVLVANLHTPEPRDLFFFRDSIEHMICSIRLGSVGIIVALDDGGLLRETYQKYLDEVNGRKLAPLQFDELYAKCLYEVSRLRSSTKFAIQLNNKNDSPVSVNMIGGPYVGEYLVEEYKPILEQILSESYPNMQHQIQLNPPNQITTWMNNENGELTLVDYKGKPLKHESAQPVGGDQ
jgi:hypothetical protein